MKTQSALLLTWVLLLLPAPVAQAHLFTDDQGRQVEAEIVGLRGANVVLATRGVRGQWPVARLAAADQAYVKEWQSANSAVKAVQVQINERDGIGERGEFPAAESTSQPALPEGLPIAPAKETRAIYKHCDLVIQNPAAVDANHLRVAYVLYLVKPDGTVGSNAGTQTVARVPAGQNARLKTEGLNAARTKATQLKLSINSNNVSLNERNVRSRDEFGGCWVRVYGTDGSLIGESRRLSAALTKLDPPWVEAEVAEDIPVLTSLDGLKELLKKLLPPEASKDKSPGLPPLPPGFPPPGR
jgi:hypothetical protein